MDMWTAWLAPEALTLRLLVRVAYRAVPRIIEETSSSQLLAGGNIGVRRRQLHALMLDPAYDDLATLDGICLAETVP